MSTVFEEKENLWYNVYFVLMLLDVYFVLLMLLENIYFVYDKFFDLIAYSVVFI